MSRSAIQSLYKLAELYDIQRSYEDFRNQRREATADTLLALLQARGASITSVAEARDVLRERVESLSCDGIAPVLTSWGGRMAGVPLRLSGAAAQRAVRYTIRFEDGTVRSAESKPEAVARRGTRPDAATHRIRGLGAIPIGYHDIEIETSNATMSARIFAAPRYAFGSRARADWGVFAPLYALHTSDGEPIGNLSHLEQLARWTAARGGAFVGTLPLLASFVDVLYEPSPYAPVSRLFWNELFVDVTRAPGWSDAHSGTDAPSGADAHGGALAPTTSHESPQDEAELVDYRAAASVKLAALRAAARSYFAAGDTSALDRFVAANERLRDYARFRAVVDRRRESWRAWPDRLRGGTILDGDFAREDERFHLYAQWVAEEQLGSIAAASDRDCAGLYLDLPLGVNADGFDAWRESSLFTDAASTGAPPDPLFTGGQDWGFHPPDPGAQRASGHRYFIDSLRTHMRHARMIRMDHVMSLYRLYWIPKGAKASDGAYVRYPVDELLAAVAIESNRHDTVVVGEDLGTVPREIRQQMERRRILRMYVVQYEISPDSEDPITPVPRDVVASVNTHDMPTFRGFVLGRDLKDQLDLGLVDDTRYKQDVEARNHLVQRLAGRFGHARTTAELLRHLLGYLSESQAHSVLVTLEDLWLEDRPQNVPGTNTERDNWKRRTRPTLEAIMSDETVLDLLAMIDRNRSAISRAALTEG
jgi:4-alpha-glucanotransferase